MFENTEKEKKFDWRYYFVKYYDTMCAGKTGIYYAGLKSGFFDISMLETTRRSSLIMNKTTIESVKSITLKEIMKMSDAEMKVAGQLVVKVAPVGGVLPLPADIKPIRFL